MKCPLFTAAEISHEPEFKPAANDCLKEECAWWLVDVNLCAMKELALEIRYAQFRLQELTERKGG